MSAVGDARKRQQERAQAGAVDGSELAVLRADRTAWREIAERREAELDEARAVIAAVGALADKWQLEYGVTARGIATTARKRAGDLIRVALDDPAANPGAVRAKVWDEGHEAGMNFGRYVKRVVNPYRADRIEGGA